MRLAEELGIAAGFRTSFLEGGIREITSILFGKELFFPSKIELILRIEAELDEKNPKRAFSIARQLAALFQRHGVYGNKACLEWDAKPEQWQEKIWKTVYESCEYPLRSLLALDKPIKTDLSLHLFGFSHLPPLYFDFFEKIGRVVPVNFYQLSACQEFWSDSTESHPLLTSFGRVGRNLASLVEQSELDTQELYEIPEGETQLHALQRELLFAEKRPRLTEGSLQLHEVCSLHHEVESLLKELITLLKADPTLEPKDILVMAPDIAPYAPSIQALFGEILPYQIADMPLSEAHPQVEALNLLLQLEKNRWSAPAVLDFFSHPLVSKKLRWSEEDLLQIRRFVESTGIRWGLDYEHRKRLLAKSHCKEMPAGERATWKGGLDFLLEELALAHEPSRIDFQQAELLGELKACLDQMALDLKEIDEKKPLHAWADWMMSLSEHYLSENEFIAQKIQQLRRVAPFEKAYGFETIEGLLKELFGEKSVTIGKHHLQSVRFCSLLPMRAIPARVIWLMGMNHDAFPRVETLLSLDWLEEGDYFPSRLDFDRYLFLEALLSAREKLYISYIGNDPYDQTPLPPSSCVEKLLPYIDPAFQFKHAPLRVTKKQPPIFLETEYELPQGVISLDLAEFARAFRSPLRHYLAERKIFLREESSLESEEPLTLSALQKAILRKEAMRGKSMLEKAQRSSNFPLGPYGELALGQLKKEKGQLVLPPSDTLVVSDPLCVAVNETLSVELTGVIEGVYDKGLLVLDKKSVKGACRAWPLFLALCAIDPSKNRLFFAKEGKEVEGFFDDPRLLLRKALNFYFLCSQKPTPLYPDWIDPFLKKKPAALEKIALFDPTYKWAARHYTLPSADRLIEKWHDVASTTYQEMCDAWF